MKQGTVGTYGSESLPNIKGSFSCDTYPIPLTANGAFTRNTLDGTYKTSGTTSTAAQGLVKFDASCSSSTYQNNAKVNPDNAEILYVIRY